MANKAQRDRDKKDKKRSFGQKTAVKTTTTTKVEVKTEAQAGALKRQISSHQMIGKKPWSHLIQMNPKRTHLNQANASARKQHQRQLRLAEMAAEAAEAKALGLTAAQLRSRRTQE